MLGIASSSKFCLLLQEGRYVIKRSEMLEPLLACRPFVVAIPELSNRTSPLRTTSSVAIQSRLQSTTCSKELVATDFSKTTGLVMDFSALVTAALLVVISSRTVLSQGTYKLTRRLSTDVSLHRLHFCFYFQEVLAPVQEMVCNSDSE